MKIKYVIGSIVYTGWCGLGFARGFQSAKYDHTKYDHTKYYSDKPNMYIDSISHGFLGTIFYANPILFPIFIYKEIYRLEVNIRKLEEEKKTSKYNDLC
jgi:hypothetical protein